MPPLSRRKVPGEDDQNSIRIRIIYGIGETYSAECKIGISDYDFTRIFGEKKKACTSPATSNETDTPLKEWMAANPTEVKVKIYENILDFRRRTRKSRLRAMTHWGSDHGHRIEKSIRAKTRQRIPINNDLIPTVVMKTVDLFNYACAYDPFDEDGPHASVTIQNMACFLDDSGDSVEYIKFEINANCETSIFYVDGKTLEFVSDEYGDLEFLRQKIGPNVTIEKMLDGYRECLGVDLASLRNVDMDIYNRMLAEKEAEERLCGPKGSIREHSDEFTALFDEMKAML